MASRVASLENQYLSGNEKVLCYMLKHHHFDGVVTQPPAFFVKKKRNEALVIALCG
jgi:hypothetical protein